MLTGCYDENVNAVIFHLSVLLHKRPVERTCTGRGERQSVARHADIAKPKTGRGVHQQFCDDRATGTIRCKLNGYCLDIESKIFKSVVQYKHITSTVTVVNVVIVLVLVVAVVVVVVVVIVMLIVVIELHQF